MKEQELLEKIKQNLFHLDWSMDDAPYHGFTGDNVRGVRFAIKKVLEGTGLTMESIHQEFIHK